MTFRFPGSLVNRALRSKLLTAQQHRASIAAALRFPQTQTWLSSSPRFYSYASERSSGRNDSYRKNSRPAPGRFEKDGQKPTNRGRGNRKTFKDGLSSKKDRDLLMAIASGKESLGGRYDVDSDIAESEALDKEAAEKWSTQTETSGTEASENDASQDQASQTETANRDAPEEPSPSMIKSLKVPNKVITEELKWLSDPRDFAERVSRILHAGDPALAAALIRTGTKQGMRCDVAWNTLFQYCMDQNHPQAAFKFYNDMKKRGRKPNPSTYTIMLKGFSSASESPNIVKTAASVYRSISSPNSGVSLSIIHTNAMLTVCQRHNDMDRLWKIAGDLPEEGPGAPDAATYTIILGAVQFAARRDIQKMSPEEIDKILERKAQAMTEGKRIWADIVYRWKNQALELDNSVVNAMASLLLDGASDIDCYNVMELYKQTMGIPILQKRPVESESSSRRRITHEETQALEQSHSERQESMEDVPFVDENNQILREAEPDEESQPLAEEQPEELEEEEPEEEESFEDLFKPVVPDSPEISFLKPDSKELTLLLNACFTITHGTEAGINYWKLLTLEDTNHLIEPDSVTYLQYFRLLRISRSSKVGVAALRDQMIPSGVANGKAFHVALSICRRDRRNHSVLQHANELMSLMGKALILPDIRVLEGYLELIQILSSQPSVLLHLRGLDMEETSTRSRLQDIGRKIQAKLRLAALATLRPYTAQLHEAMEFGAPSHKTRWSALQNQKSDSVAGASAVKVLSRIRLVVDDTLKVDYKSFVSKAERKILMEESNMLKKYSDKDVIQNFRGKTIYPTPEQKRFGGERIKKFQLEAQKTFWKKNIEDGSSQQVEEKVPEWDESFPKKD
ncbi:hypothetical protein PENARI_c007G09540 [Penicillium arizonense]|uniref:Pentatricopeptide repeat protein n=1 Tax=Penicillium arizonense TaxID=1835702 RepID=A0A1F5LL67_PENAI|nr:hypothetical protein PENARI_c007G09540 [Penicillium arizonense]OGE53649.1 hypothetical protein PENARI_c007G09540 [Penicillium arizonense]